MVCIFFYVQNEFPSFGKVTWKTDRTIISQVNDYIEQLGDNFESIMTSYFEDFKKTMKQRIRIPVSLVEKHINDICFLVDIDYTYIQVAIPRVRWLRPLGYELNVDEASAAITALLAKEVDKTAKPFGIFDVVKSKIATELKTSTVIKKKDKLVRKLKKKFGEGIGTTTEEEDEDDDDEDDEGEEPLELTQGLGEDKDEGAEEEESKEAPTQVEPKKRKTKAQPESKKVAKPTQVKTQSPTTRETTRASTQRTKKIPSEKEEVTKETGGEKKRKRRYVAQPDYEDEEKTKSDDISHFRVVSHPQKPNLDKICDDVKNANFDNLKGINFEKPSREENNKLENSIYAMMAQFKYTPLELDNTMPKELYEIVEDK